MNAVALASRSAAPPAPSRRPELTSALALVAAALLFGAMATVAKAASHRLPGVEVGLVRALVGMVACAVVAARRPFVVHNRGGLALRGLFGGVAVYLFFTTIEHLPIGVATLLNYTAPVFTALWAALFLGEAVGPRALGALGLTTLGVGLVIKGNAPPGGLGLGTWQLVGLCSAMLSGAAVATIREVRKTDGAWEIFAAFCAMCIVVTIGPAIHLWVSPTPLEWVELLGVGLLAALAQVLMTSAMADVRASVAGIISQLTPITALALGSVVYGERISHLGAFGAAVTLAGVSWGARIAVEPSGASKDAPRAPRRR